MKSKKFALVIALVMILLVAAVGCTKKSTGEQIFQKLTGKTPIPMKKTAGEYVQMAEYSLDREDIDQALEYCQKALELDPKSGEAYFVIGVANMMNHNLDIAAENFNKALELDPKVSMAHAYLGSIYFSQGDYGKSVEQYGKVLDKAKHMALFNNHRGLAYLMMGKLDKARKDFDDAIKKEPEDGAGYDNAALVLILQNKNHEAREMLEKAVSINPELPGPYESLGILGILNGNYKAARENLNKSLDLDDTSFLALYLIYYIDKKEGAQADKVLEAALKSDLKLSYEGLKVLEALARHYPKTPLGKAAGEISGKARKEKDKKFQEKTDK